MLTFDSDNNVSRQQSLKWLLHPPIYASPLTQNGTMQLGVVQVT